MLLELGKPSTSRGFRYGGGKGMQRRLQGLRTTNDAFAGLHRSIGESGANGREDAGASSPQVAQAVMTGLENLEFLDLLLQYKKVRSRTVRICDALEIEDTQIQSMPDVSPPKWHLAHTSWFFENFLLKAAVSGYEVFHPRFHFIFNSYYKSQGEHYERVRRGFLSRPSLKEVLRYREHVDNQMFRLLSGTSSSNLGWNELKEIVTLGLHHEQQHQELLLTDIQHILGTQPLRPAYEGSVPVFAELAQARKKLEYVPIPGGVQKVGWGGTEFAFDNERPVHSVYLEEYQLASRPVTNGEYLEFVLAGGYQNPKHWLSDGWDWVQKERWASPLYWEKNSESGEWLKYGLRGMEKLQEHEPVCHLSYYEADAYARWRGARLPTEFEWENAIRHRAISIAGVGQTWEWTSSAYLPYPGFQSFAGDFGEYNGKFMSGQMVLRGGSIATPRGHHRLTYRNFFPPSARWQFSGVRLAL